MAYYFSGKENHLISEILFERIGRFITNFGNQISKDDLIKLSSNVLIRTSIFDLLLIDLKLNYSPNPYNNIILFN